MFFRFFVAFLVFSSPLLDGVTVLEEDVTVLDEGVTTLEDDSATVLGDALKDGVTVQECDDKTIMLVSILPLVFCFLLSFTFASVHKTMYSTNM